MNLFLKQISTIFFSLFFFLLSGEAWGTSITFTSLTNCTTFCDGGSGKACNAHSTTYSYFGTNPSGTTFAITGDYITVGPGASAFDHASNVGSKAHCMLDCSAKCTSYLADYTSENNGERALNSTSSNTFSKSICNAFRIVTGSAGKTFAAFAIIATGIGFFSGKVSWGLMIGVAAGIATMFGAPSIVAAISGTTVNTQCTLAAGAYTP
jgi:type IV secretory pathway VirB2 component (pilin)